MIDSGLGGLSICADIAERMKQDSAFEKVFITYYNAWPAQNLGYNKLASTEQRVCVFDNALAGAKAFHPDLILVACNTLSVLYPQTQFSRNEQLPVMGIVDFGVALILRHLNDAPNGQVIIFGTLTTIETGTHKALLMANGIASDRIVLQACDQLATAIEDGPDTPVVNGMIQRFVGEAVSKLSDPKAPVFAALCCTHYGYSRAAFERELGTHLTAAAVLNPNAAMATSLFSGKGSSSGGATKVDLDVVSRIVWSPEKLTVIADAIAPKSSATVEALKNYRHLPDLFDIDACIAPGGAADGHTL